MGEVCGYSTPARAHPEHNEDTVLALPEYGLAAVFDGLGGHSAGECASAAAARGVCSLIDQLPAADDLAGCQQWLQAAITAAGAAVATERAQAHNDQATTVAMAVRTARHVCLAWIGDSRIYRMGKSLELLSFDDTPGVPAAEDHSQAAEEFRAQQLALDHLVELTDLQAHPELIRPWSIRNVVSQIVPDDADHPHLACCALDPDDLIIITSDGIHDNLAFNNLVAVIAAARASGPQHIVEQLVGAARQVADAGGLRAKDDDMSAAVLA